MSAHDELKAAGITPTIDAEKAFTLGYAAALGDVAHAAEIRSRESRTPQTAGTATAKPPVRGTTHRP